MSYRDDLDALAARHDALAAEVAERTRERDRAADLLRDAQARARLPVLDNIRVAAPCPADWSTMTGDDRVRACGACAKHVYNLSAMTRDEAEALIRASEGALCVRYYRRADGTIMTKDCAIGVRRRRRRVVVAGVFAALAGAIGVGATTGSVETVTGQLVVDEPHGPAVMGEISATPPPTAPTK